MAGSYVVDQLLASTDRGFTCPEAETNILYRMIMRQGVAEEVAMELSQEDFSNREYGKLFRAVQALVAGRMQIDMVSVDAQMTKLYGAEWRPESLVEVCKKHDFTVAKWQDIRDHIKIVKDLSRRRQAIAQLEGLVEKLHDPTKDISETLSSISDTADGIDTGDAEWNSIGDVMLSTYTYIEKRQKGEIRSITTGLGNLDRLTGGFFDGELTIIAARPSVGKSAFGANVALAAARQGFKVGVVSCEMSKVGIGQRLLSRGAFVDGMKLRKADVDDESWSKLCDAMADMDGLPIRFLFECNTCEDIVNVSRKLARRGELDMLVVDYLQYMDTRRQFKEERHRVGFIVRSMKKLALRAGIPVLLLSQLTREGEGRMPTLKMLRESGDIEQDADGVIFLHRPDSSSDPCVDPRDRGSVESLRDRGLAYLALGVAKQRNGPIGQVNVVFDGAFMQYAEIARS